MKNTKNDYGDLTSTTEHISYVLSKKTVEKAFACFSHMREV